MTTEQLVSSLTARGVRLVRRGDRLGVDAPKGVLGPDDRADLARHKPALLDLLHRADLPADPGDWKEGVRCVLAMHVENGMTPAEAEARTRSEWRVYLLAGAPECVLVAQEAPDAG